MGAIGFLGEHQATSTWSFLGDGKSLHAKHKEHRVGCELRMRSPQGAGLDCPREDEMVVGQAIAIVRLVEDDDTRVKRLLIGVDGKLIATSKLCRLLDCL